MIGFDYAERVERLQGLMSGRGVDVVLLSVGPDLPYFSGYEALPSERLTVMVVRREGDPALLVPALEAPRVPTGDFEIRAWGEMEDPVEIASRIAGSPEVVAVGDHMWSRFLVALQKEWPHASWRPASNLTNDLRIRKEPGEIEVLRSAAHAVDRVMAAIGLTVSFAGRSERQIAKDVAALIVEEGHDAAEFTIVASGPNGASPHHEPAERIVVEGDLVVCDIGGRRDGYFSDSTRTFVVGEPSSEQLEVHDLVLAANATGRASVRPGVQCQEVDRAARAVIDQAGHGDHFIHRTGHGIGLEVHEHPYLVEGNTRPLEPGMAFSVEPGIYIAGRFGVRIEDIVVCTGDGSDVLNESDRSLLSVA